MKYFIICIIALLIPLIVPAYPAMSGASGYALMPSAYVTPVGTCEVAYDLLSTPLGARHRVRGCLGLADRAEFSAEFEQNSAATATTLGVKYHVAAIAPHAALAAGMTFSRAQFDSATDQGRVVPYVAGTTFIRQRGSLQRGTVTLGLQLQDDLNGHGTGARFFAGADATFALPITVMLEVASRSHEMGDLAMLWSGALRYPVRRTVIAQLGITNHFANDSLLFLGASYGIDTQIPGGAQP